MRKICLFISCCFMILNAEFRVKSMSEIKNETFIKQHFEESCGAASLANLANFFSFKRFSEEQIIKILNQKTDMLSFLELKDTAIKMGFNSDGYQLSREDFDKVKIPVIVKVENDPRFPHFVVVINYDGDYIRVLDPNFGAYTSSKAEFYSIWDKDNVGGFVLIILPKDFTGFSADSLYFFNNNYLDKIKLNY